MVVTTAGNQARPSEGTVRPVGGVRRIETAQQLAQALRIVQVEPAHHCLKSRGPTIDRWIEVPGTTTGCIATPPDPLPFLIPQQRFEPLEGQALGLGPDAGDTGGMEQPRAGGPPHQRLTLMQLPDSIPEPGQLGRARAGLRRR
jgi:hypothetical protein